MILQLVLVTTLVVLSTGTIGYYGRGGMMGGGAMSPYSGGMMGMMGGMGYGMGGGMMGGMGGMMGGMGGMGGMMGGMGGMGGMMGGMGGMGGMMGGMGGMMGGMGRPWLHCRCRKHCYPWEFYFGKCWWCWKKWCRVRCCRWVF